MTRLFGWDALEADAVDDARSRVLALKETAEGDSPIERLFLGSLITVCKYRTYWHDSVAVWNRVPLEMREEALEDDRVLGLLHRALYVECQADVGGWRADFLIQVWDRFDTNDKPVWRSLIVECDGHEFHERTRDQAARDRSRDRLAQLNGAEIFRFTGSELWRDPVGCASQVLKWAATSRRFP